MLRGAARHVLRQGRAGCGDAEAAAARVWWLGVAGEVGLVVKWPALRKVTRKWLWTSVGLTGDGGMRR